MQYPPVAVLVGFLIGTLGTLIGAGGGFILVPLLLILQPQLPPEIVTAISIAVVAANAVSGTIAYARLGRIDYRAGLLFAAFTIPGSILGVYATRFVPRHQFQLIFGIALIAIGIVLFVRKETVREMAEAEEKKNRHWHDANLTDREGTLFKYRYNQTFGMLISLVVGFISPLLGIGGGIIHVPFLVRALRFPVYVATATSHFILSIMATVSVIMHLANGVYAKPGVGLMTASLCAGALGGAQLGAWLSHRVRGSVIVRTLAVCLALVGIRMLLSR